MRLISTFVLSVVVLAPAGNDLFAQDDFIKDGQLTQELKVVQLQGGFAGFTGVQYTIARDGSWTSEGIFNEKKKTTGKGKLSKKKLEKLAAILEKYNLARLPAKSGKRPGANPHILTFEFGDKKFSRVGQLPPKLNPKNPTGSVESRFAGIWEGVVGLLTPSPKEK